MSEIIDVTPEPEPDGRPDNLPVPCRQPPADPEPPRPRERIDVPMIQNKVGHGLGEWVDFGLFVLQEFNDPPRIFLRGDHLVHLRYGKLAQLDTASLRWYLSNVSNWHEVTFGPPTKAFPQGTRKIKNVPPPPEVLANILATPEYDRRIFPVLDAAIHAPAFAESGRLVDTPGYDRESRLYYFKPEGLTYDSVPDTPSRKLVAVARGVIDELLADFPFETPAARAATVAAFVLPTARKLVPGNTPLHMISSPAPESGKSTLAQLLAIPSTGSPTPTKSEITNENQFKTVVTATLATSPPVILFDNLLTAVEGSAWAAALTAPIWEDRPYHSNSRLVQYPNNALWAATANNPVIAPDMLLRSVLIPLDTGLENPGARDYKHPEILGWAAQKRGALVWAILIIVQNWIAKGRPDGSIRHNRYLGWGRVMGGILEAAGIAGFLETSPTSTTATDPETQRWHILIATWLRAFGESEADLDRIYLMIAREDMLAMLFSAILPRGDEPERKSRLRQALVAQRRRIYKGYTIVALGGGWRFRLEAADPNTPDPGPELDPVTPDPAPPIPDPAPPIPDPTPPAMDRERAEYDVMIAESAARREARLAQARADRAANLEAKRQQAIAEAPARAVAYEARCAAEEEAKDEAERQADPQGFAEREASLARMLAQLAAANE